MINSYQIVILIIVVINVSEIKGLVNGTVTVAELKGYEKQHCSLSNGFEHQFLCTYIIVNGTRNTLDKQCMIEAFYREAYSTVILMQFWDLILQNVLEKPYKVNCNTYLLLIQEMYLMPILFSHVNGHSRFYPFTNIIVLFDLPKGHSHDHFSRKDHEYVSKNSLNVIYMHYSDMKETPNNIEFNRILTGEKFSIVPKTRDSRRKSGWSESKKLFDEDKLINTLIANKEGLMNLTVSLFQCPPFVYYVKKGNSTKFDGVEYRFLNETAKNWGRKYILRDSNTSDPYKKTVEDVHNNVANMTMCSLWMVEDNAKQIELSRGYDTQCITFVVPMQTPLTQASLIYLTLDYKVWSILAFTFAISSILLRIVAFVGQKFIKKGYAAKYNSTSMSALEMINIITTHGVPKFPIHLPVRILVMSWTFFSLLIGSGYVTGYTSLLTIPRLTNPINRLVDFLEQGIGWGEPYKDPTVLSYLYKTENPDYIELAKRMTVEDSLETIYKKLEKGNYGRYTRTLADSFVMGAESYMHLAKSLRVMTQCVFKYFSVFGFEKQSPFRKIFDRQIPRFVESGILNQWFKELITLYSDNNMQYFFDFKVQKSPVKPLRLTNLFGALYLLAIGLGISTLVFIGEIVVYKTKMKTARSRILANKKQKAQRRIKLLRDRVKELQRLRNTIKKRF